MQDYIDWLGISWKLYNSGRYLDSAVSWEIELKFDSISIVERFLRDEVSEFRGL